MSSLPAIEKKWQKEWGKQHAFQPKIDGREKFFLTFPYPYANSYLHIGHFYTLMRVEAFARYKRLRGYNVLFPQGWHATGSPIVNAAKRVEEREPKQVKIMTDLGFTEDDLKRFEDPEEWIKFFPVEGRKDLVAMGFSIDWRREFITTSMNPYYDKFIRWQFNKLKEKKYVIRGKFPVVWCNKCHSPVSDHSRLEGEGETTQEFTLLKFRFENDKQFIVAATLRPETVFGQTNMWVHPDIEYVKAKVNNEVWIISKECVEKLKEQDKKVGIVGKIKGTEMLGKYCTAPGINREIIILPSYICDPKIGTGLVTSVPSHAVFDYAALVDLQKDNGFCEKFGLDHQKVKNLKPIALIKLEGWGEHPAKEYYEKEGIKSQKEYDKLEHGKQLIYKEEHHKGMMLDNTGRYKGMKVEEAKEAVKNDLIAQGKADRIYELTGKVVCRCLTPSLVKIVDDQWFIDYGNEEWKKSAHKALDCLKLYPEKARVQFDYVIDWLRRWACTREEGLGTRLPWDEKWLIESLSDSTIYMAYYTISHLITRLPLEKVDDTLFDYILLGKGKKPAIDDKLLSQMKAEFEYWYPVDFRNSGKDLIQNHLAFFLFNHAAIFPERHWPKGIGVNGWVMVDGEKMSKSKGNVIPLRQLAKDYTVDGARITILSGGESMDDPNWDSEFARSVVPKLEQLLVFVRERYNNGKSEMLAIDKWALSEMNRIIGEATSSMDETLFRSAIQQIFFDMNQVLKWYIYRTGNNPNRDVVNAIIESQTIMLSPFTPHLCEEIWHGIGKQNLVSLANWPKADRSRITPVMGSKENLVRNSISDIRSILNIVKIEKPEKITLIVPEAWKYEFYKIVMAKLNETRDFKELLAHVMATDLKKHGKEISKMLPKLAKSEIVKDILSLNDEMEALEQSLDFFSSEFKCRVEMVKAEDSKDPKKNSALPGKPAIVIS